MPFTVNDQRAQLSMVRSDAARRNVLVALDLLEQSLAELANLKRTWASETRDRLEACVMELLDEETQSMRSLCDELVDETEAWARRIAAIDSPLMEVGRNA